MIGGYRPRWVAFEPPPELDCSILFNATQGENYNGPWMNGARK